MSRRRVNILKVDGMGHQRLFERACPGPVDRPHRARLYPSTFWVQDHWSRWAPTRKYFTDPRWHGKIRCEPDATWDTTAATGLDEALCRALDYTVPKIFFRKPLLGFFLLWLLAILELGPIWEDSPPTPQHKAIETYRGGEEPFHHIERPDEAEERRLLKLARNGDIIARNTLIAGHLWIAEKVAAEFGRWVDSSEFDDLRQEAAIALFKAVDGHDPESGNRFSTFAWNVVRRDVQDWLRKHWRLKRHPSTELIAEKGEAALGLYASNSVKPSVEYKIFRGLFKKTWSRSE